MSARTPFVPLLPDVIAEFRAPRRTNGATVAPDPTMRGERIPTRPTSLDAHGRGAGSIGWPSDEIVIGAPADVITHVAMPGSIDAGIVPPRGSEAIADHSAGATSTGAPDRARMDWFGPPVPDRAVTGSRKPHPALPVDGSRLDTERKALGLQMVSAVG